MSDSKYIMRLPMMHFTTELQCISLSIMYHAQLCAPHRHTATNCADSAGGTEGG